MRVYQNKVEHKLRKKKANFRKSYTTVVQYGIEYRYCCICENLRDLRSKYSFETVTFLIKMLFRGFCDLLPG